MSDTDKVLLLLFGIKHKISARQDYYVSFMRYQGGEVEGTFTLFWNFWNYRKGFYCKTACL